MIKFLGITIAVLFCSALIKDKNRVFAMILSVVGVLILFALAINEIKSISDSIIAYTSGFNTVIPYVKLMLKVLGITLATQIISDICRDNGENALASVTEIVAKVFVIVMILPLFDTVISIVSGLVK